MKKLTRVLFMFAVMAASVLGAAKAASAQVIEVTAQNFPDAAVRNELKQYATEENASGSEAPDTGFHIDTDKVTQLGIYKEVKDLTGIGLLTKLESLRLASFGQDKLELNNSSLKQLDLDGPTCKKLQISVPKLETLVIASADGGKLSSVDLSKNKNLKYFVLQGTKISSIDVSKNTKLTNLNLLSNNLTSVNVSKNKNLSVLMLHGKKIKPVNLSKNTKLKQLSIDGSKKIKSVNLKKNTKLTALSLTNIGMKKVDLSKNKKLTGLACYGTKISSLNLKKYTKLETLDVSNTKLSSLDLKKVKNLRRIGYYGTKIKKLSLAKYGVVKQKEQYPYNTFTIHYKVKKGTTINLKPYLGTGYKCSFASDGASYNKSKNTIKVKGKANTWASLSLEKGKKVFSISIEIIK
ncbi:MAG: hypothetical protein NC131_19630 [Roseburia sp.]|nr:hypothetical protein [Roseburia sp.]